LHAASTSPESNGVENRSILVEQRSRFVASPYASSIESCQCVVYRLHPLATLVVPSRHWTCFGEFLPVEQHASSAIADLENAQWPCRDLARSVPPHPPEPSIFERGWSLPPLTSLMDHQRHWHPYIQGRCYKHSDELEGTSSVDPSANHNIRQTPKRKGTPGGKESWGDKERAVDVASNPHAGTKGRLYDRRTRLDGELAVSGELIGVIQQSFDPQVPICVLEWSRSCGRTPKFYAVRFICFGSPHYPHSSSDCVFVRHRFQASKQASKSCRIGGHTLLRYLIIVGTFAPFRRA